MFVPAAGGVCVVVASCGETVGPCVPGEVVVCPLCGDAEVASKIEPANGAEGCGRVCDGAAALPCGACPAGGVCVEGAVGGGVVVVVVPVCGGVLAEGAGVNGAVVGAPVCCPDTDGARQTSNSAVFKNHRCEF